jgi:hypothetical protein
MAYFKKKIKKKEKYWFKKGGAVKMVKRLTFISPGNHSIKSGWFTSSQIAKLLKRGWRKY